jgi:hypothetical protein
MDLFARAQAPLGVSWLNTSMVDLLPAALLLLTVALFAAMIWAGNHQH